MSKKKVAVYIDGFNYYYAIIDYLRNSDNKVSLKWLDYRKFITESVLKDTEYSKSDLKINFYTAINGYRKDNSVAKHEIYLEALRNKNINVVKGYYKLRETFLGCHVTCEQCTAPVYVKKYTINGKPLKCSRCKKDIDLSIVKTVQHPEEKQTDVNIAKDILVDALQENPYDIFILLSTDSDFVPVADHVVNVCKKEFWVIAPATKIVRKSKNEQGELVEKGEYRYGIDKFLDIGANSQRIRIPRLNRYQLPNPFGNIKKPSEW